MFQNAIMAHHFAEDVFSYMRVHGAKWIVEEVNITVTIHGPRKAHALLLSS